MHRSGLSAALLAMLILGFSVGCQPAPHEQEVHTGSAKVSWEPPTEREDGSTLSSVDGYTIYFGRDPENLEYSLDVSGELTEYEIEGLEPGTWYFAITARSENGVESRPSAVASKKIALTTREETASR